MEVLLLTACIRIVKKEAHHFHCELISALNASFSFPSTLSFSLFIFYFYISEFGATLVNSHFLWHFIFSTATCQCKKCIYSWSQHNRNDVINMEFQVT